MTLKQTLTLIQALMQTLPEPTQTLTHTELFKYDVTSCTSIPHAHPFLTLQAGLVQEEAHRKEAGPPQDGKPGSSRDDWNSSSSSKCAAGRYARKPEPCEMQSGSESWWMKDADGLPPLQKTCVTLMRDAKRDRYALQ